jgi:hypothetical protein
MLETYYYLLYKIKSFSYSFPRGIKNLIKWRKTIWNDRDFDYYYIYEILKKKLEFMADHTEKNSMLENADQHAKEMRECVKLIHAIQHEEFETEAAERCISTSLNDNMTNEEFKQIFEEAQRKTEEAKSKLFDTLKNKIEHWWD